MGAGCAGVGSITSSRHWRLWTASELSSMGSNMSTWERNIATQTHTHGNRSRVSGHTDGVVGGLGDDGRIRAEVSTYNRLWTLARNLWWTWQPEVTRLFRELDPIRWRQLAHNPIALLS